MAELDAGLIVAYVLFIIGGILIIVGMIIVIYYLCYSRRYKKYVDRDAKLRVIYKDGDIRVVPQNGTLTTMASNNNTLHKSGTLTANGRIRSVDNADGRMNGTLVSGSEAGHRYTANRSKQPTRTRYGSSSSGQKQAYNEGMLRSKSVDDIRAITTYKAHAKGGRAASSSGTQVVQAGQPVQYMAAGNTGTLGSGPVYMYRSQPTLLVPTGNAIPVQQVQTLNPNQPMVLVDDMSRGRVQGWLQNHHQEHTSMDTELRAGEHDHTRSSSAQQRERTDLLQASRGQTQQMSSYTTQQTATIHNSSHDHDPNNLKWSASSKHGHEGDHVSDTSYAAYNRGPHQVGAYITEGGAAVQSF